MIQAFAVARYGEEVQESEVLPSLLQAWHSYDYFKNLMAMCIKFVLEREREVFYILCPASSLMDVPGYVNPDKLMNAPIGFVCR